MKRLTCLLLICCLFLSGCTMFGARVKEPVTFYYIRSDYQETMQSVIGSEIREAAGHRSDLPYLLALYSMGPSSESLVSAFPKNIKIIPTEHTEKGIVLSISDELLDMTESEFTLACACLSLTCMELTDAEKITLVSGERKLAIRKDNLLTLENLVWKNMEE